ncbi:MAG: hypothetical protein ABWY58_16640 [Aeromicrobium sp.]
MTDDEMLAELQAILDADAEADDEGRDRRVTSMGVVQGEDGFDDLEVTLVVDGTTVVSRLLFDRAWREDSGLTDPTSYAAFVKARWQAGVTSLGDVMDDAGPAAQGGLGSQSQDELWQALERALWVEAAGVNRVGHGTWEVVAGDGDPFTVHVTPPQWRRMASGREDDALDQLDDVIGSRWDDEEHIVSFRGAFHPSVRAELPPLRSRLSPE